MFAYNIKHDTALIPFIHYILSVCSWAFKGLVPRVEANVAMFMIKLALAV